MNDSFINKVIGSVAQMDFYKRAIQLPVSKAFIYLLLLSVCLGSIVGVTIIFQVASDVSEYLESMPDFVLQDGRLNVDIPMPYQAEQTKESPFIAIDTSGTLTPDILDQHERGIFITDRGMTMKKNDVQTDYIDFAKLASYRITKETLGGYVSGGKYLTFLGVPFYDVYYYMEKLITALVLALIGLVAGAVLKADITFSNAFKIGIYSLTLPMILDTLHVLIRERIPHFSLLYYVVAIVYVILALRALGTQKQQAGLPPSAV